MALFPTTSDNLSLGIDVAEIIIKVKVFFLFLLFQKELENLLLCSFHLHWELVLSLHLGIYITISFLSLVLH